MIEGWENPVKYALDVWFESNNKEIVLLHDRRYGKIINFNLSK